MAKKKEPVVDNDQIITLDDKDYKYSELTNEGKLAVQHLNAIQREIISTKFLLERHEGTKRYFIDTLSKIVYRDEEPDV